MSLVQRDIRKQNKKTKSKLSKEVEEYADQLASLFIEHAKYNLEQKKKNKSGKE